MGAIVSEGQMRTIAEYVESAREEGAEVFQPDLPVPPHGLYYPPTLITKIQTVSKCVQEEVSFVISCKQCKKKQNIYVCKWMCFLLLQTVTDSCFSA